jgi:hypothetical protein
MNYLIEFLLEIKINIEDSFWILTNILENILPIDYFTSMLTLKAD